MSLQAIQDGVRAFEQRREMGGKPLDAANPGAVTERRVPDAENSDAKQETAKPAAEARHPPDGTSAKCGGEAKTVETVATPRRATTTKARPKVSTTTPRQAVTYDVDLWIDFRASCTLDSVGQCGQWASQSNIDNVEYLIIDNPPAGKYRLKAVNWRAPSSGLPVAIAAKIVRGDPTPAMTMSAAPSSATPVLGSTFTVTATVANPAYEAYGVQVSAPAVPSGLTLLGVSATREDGVAMDFPNASGLTLGTVTEADTRTAVWRFRADAKGPQTVRFRAWSNNGGTAFQSVTVTP